MSESATSRVGPRVFPVTQWTVVLAAGATPSPESAAALERLCQAYWYPLYAFVRRSGYSPADAEDLAQEFFARLLEHNWIAYADRHKGRFRSFLLMAMKRFLANEWKKAKALKRGGKARLVPLQLDTAETRYRLEPADTRTPEQVFEKQWALALLESVLRRMREDYARGKGGAIRGAGAVPGGRPRGSSLCGAGGATGNDGGSGEGGGVPDAGAVSGVPKRGNRPNGGVAGRGGRRVAPPVQGAGAGLKISPVRM